LNNYDYDILIVGGGLVGASLALGLNQLPLKVGLIDSGLIKKAPISNRTIALSAISCQILQALSNCSLDELKVHPIKTIHVSKQGRFAITRLKAEDIGLPALGYSIEMATIVQFLYEALNKTCCEVIPAQVKDAKCELATVEVVLETASTVQEKISTKLLIAADGDNSFLRTLFNIPTKVHDYEQSALVATVATTKSHQDTAFERFIVDGSVALLPVAEKKVKLVWVASTDNIKTLANLDACLFLNRLQDHIGFRLGKLHSLGESHIYPLKRVQVLDQVQDRLVLLGNSAHVLHPIAAQGFNLSLRDIAVFIATIQEAHAKEKNFAAKEILQNYVVKRLSDQKRAENLTHYLASLFNEDLSPLAGLCSVAFNALESLPILKKRFIHFAMGSYVKLPSWVWGS